MHAFDQAIKAVGANDGAIALEFPPLLPQVTFDTTGYLRSFPNLAGSVFSFAGGDHEYADLLRRLDDGEPYSEALDQSDVALSPACCYPVYPSLRGMLQPEGIIIEIRGYCFRNEPSVDPMRMRAFRQREHVRVGTPEQVIEWRQLWLERAPQVFDDVGLDAHSEVANDPFFGRAGRLMSMSQREQELKIEFVVPVFETSIRRRARRSTITRNISAICSVSNPTEVHRPTRRAPALDSSAAPSRCLPPRN